MSVMRAAGEAFARLGACLTLERHVLSLHGYGMRAEFHATMRNALAGRADRQGWPDELDDALRV